MDAPEFVDAIRKYVRDSAIRSTLEMLKNPYHGRKVPQEMIERSQWYNSLAPAHKELVEGTLEEAVDYALHGFLCVLDGVKVIDKNPHSRFEITYVGDETIVLNPPEGINLYELYNA